MIFGRKKPEGKTLLLLDVENGSVGAALVRLEEGEAPKLFGEAREYFKIAPTRDSVSLLDEAKRAVGAALRRTAQVAAQLRNHEHTAPVGAVSGAAAFLAAPWGRPNLSGEPLFASPAQELVQEGLVGAFGGLPLSIHTAAGGALGGMRRLLPYEQSYLLCTVGGEVTELLLVDGHVATGYATAPLGRHSAVRTLRTHGGLSMHEAQSALRLGQGSMHEAAAEAARHYAEGIADAASEMAGVGDVSRVYVASADNNAEWFARALSHHPDMSVLFPRGGTVRALSPRHIAPALAAHAHEPDTVLGLQALFVDDTF